MRIRILENNTTADQLVAAFRALIRVRNAVNRQTLRLRILSATDLLLNLIDELSATAKFDTAENDLRSAKAIYPPIF